MRALMVLLLAGSAAADPAPDPKPDKDSKPITVPHVRGMSEAQRGIELVPSTDYWNQPNNTVTKAPSFGGGTALGMVQRPEWHNDMRPYSEGGMVIRPPWTGDDMNIAPGTSWLTDGPPLRSFWNALKFGADRMFEKLIPSAGGT